VITAENLKFLQQHVYSGSGIVLDETKRYLLEARLGPIAARENLSSLNHLCQVLLQSRHTPLHEEVVEVMTTNETLFFRDTVPFEILRNRVLPELIAKRRAVRTLNVWSAASSTGQEIYSVAILLRELGLDEWTIRLLGTDLADKVLAKARSGRYLQLEVNRGVSPQVLSRYFEQDGGYWVIRPELRKMVRFERFDLRRSASSLGLFDIVLCRNVLIYFDSSTKRKVLSNIREVMRSDAYLLLGTAESAVDWPELFDRYAPGGPGWFQPSLVRKA
jgi:chemotaxis protein methyltransferase CheR